VVLGYRREDGGRQRRDGHRHAQAENGDTGEHPGDVVGARDGADEQRQSGAGDQWSDSHRHARADPLGQVPDPAGEQEHDQGERKERESGGQRRSPSTAGVAARAGKGHRRGRCARVTRFAPVNCADRNKVSGTDEWGGGPVLYDGEGLRARTPTTVVAPVTGLQPWTGTCHGTIWSHSEDRSAER
jgi:hypothetical protein